MTPPKGFITHFRLARRAEVRKVRRPRWKATCLEISVIWYDEGTTATRGPEFFQRPCRSVLSDANEVSIRPLSPDGGIHMDRA